MDGWRTRGLDETSSISMAAEIGSAPSMVGRLAVGVAARTAWPTQPMDADEDRAAEVVTLSLGTHSACYIAHEHGTHWGRNQHGHWVTETVRTSLAHAPGLRLWWRSMLRVTTVARPAAAPCGVGGAPRLAFRTNQVSGIR